MQVRIRDHDLLHRERAMRAERTGRIRFERDRGDCGCERTDGAHDLPLPAGREKRGRAGEGLDGTFTTGPTPAVATEAATSLGETTATVHGTVNPQGAAVTKCQFEYGTASVSEHTEPCSPAGLGSGSTPVAVSASLTGLSAHTTYKFLLVAANASGKSQGTELTFTTTGTVVCTSGCGGGGGGGGGEGGGEGGGGGGGGGWAGGGAPGGGVLGNVVVKAVPIATLAGASASVSSAGAFTLKVSCPAGESSCSGVVTLKTLKAVGVRAAPTRVAPCPGSPHPPDHGDRHVARRQAPLAKRSPRELSGRHVAPRQHLGGGRHAAPPSGTGAPAQAVVTVARPVIRSAGIGRM